MFKIQAKVKVFLLNYLKLHKERQDLCSFACRWHYSSWWNVTVVLLSCILLLLLLDVDYRPLEKVLVSYVRCWWTRNFFFSLNYEQSLYWTTHVLQHLPLYCFALHRKKVFVAAFFFSWLVFIFRVFFFKVFCQTLERYYLFFQISQSSFFFKVEYLSRFKRLTFHS